MTKWYCKDCPLTGSDCGSWDDQGELFKNVRLVHKDHRQFQIGEPVHIGKTNCGHTGTKLNSSQISFGNLDEMFHNLVYSYKGPSKCCLLKDKPKELRK